MQKEIAARYHAAGLSVIPVHHGEKNPVIPSWKDYQSRLPTTAEINAWFSINNRRLAVVCGKVSGALELIDFDEPELFPKWQALVQKEDPALFPRLLVEKSPSGGFHVVYRCPSTVIPGNQKFARRGASCPNGDKILIHGKEFMPRKQPDGSFLVIYAMIESRGEGGYFVAAPSAGYTLLQGDFTTPPMISADERDLLLNAARSFNEFLPPAEKEPAKKTKKQSAPDDLSPGDDFSARGDVRALLLQHGWTRITQGGDKELWRRPGKSHNWSASLFEGRTLYVFSSNAAPFEPEKAYSPFGILTMLEHNGDYSAAAKALFAQGYGSKKIPAQTQPTVDDLPLPEIKFPDPPAPEAYYGLAGDFVRAVEPHSEADPVALLISYLVFFGNCIGRGCHWRVGGDEHHANEFAVLVGDTAGGRKGTSAGEARRPFNFNADGSGWVSRIKTGLSSGEGLIWQIRDPITITKRNKDGVITAETTDEGEPDKRLLLIEPEFAQVLKQFDRAGNTLSPIIRLAWERGELASLTKNSPAKSTGAHVSIIGHITKQELLRHLNTTEAANGAANRFLFLAVRRSKMLPDGGTLPPSTIVAIRQCTELAVASARALNFFEISRDSQAADFWRSVYPSLSSPKPGLVGAICGRAESHVLRLALIYALLDQSTTINLPHLQAALALWSYCLNSVDFIFGHSLGDETADQILDALAFSPSGLSRTELHAFFQRHLSSSEIARALSLLLSLNKIKSSSFHPSSPNSPIKSIERFVIS